MPKFQGETFDFGPLEWCWQVETLLGLAWPTDIKVANPCPYFWAHVDGSLVAIKIITYTIRLLRVDEIIQTSLKFRTILII